MVVHKVAKLVLDYTIYPRKNLNTQNVSQLVNAKAMGEELPPIIIDKKSKRVVDGFHRVKAAIRHDGPQAEIECIEKTYKNDGELFADAMRYNAMHGCKLDTWDRTHCVIVAENLGLSAEAIAKALRMPVKKIENLRVQNTAWQPLPSGKGRTQIPLKRSCREMAGEELSKEQVEQIEHLSGNHQLRTVNELIRLIEYDFLDLENEKLMERIGRLSDLLSEILAKV